MNLPRFAVKYPISVIMLFLGIILLGQISLRELGTDLLPDISSPKIVVKIEAGEIPPEEMERNYTERVESFVSTLNKVKRVSSSSRTGVSIVTVEFMWETDMDFALLDVQKAVAPFSNDRQISNISIDRFDPRSAPIMTVSVIPKDERDLDEVRSDVEKVIKLRLERLDGVAAAVLTGGREKEIVIRMLPYRLQAYGLQPGDIQRSIQATNVNLSAGEIEDNEKVYLVKGIGKFRNLDDLRNLVVGYRTIDPGSGRNQQAANQFDPGSRVPVYLADVAEVLYRDKDFNSIVRFNGKEGLGIALYKESNSNTVTTSRQIREALEGLRLDLPDLELTIAKDQAGFIEKAIDEVEIAALVGIILAVLVLSLFLRSLWTTAIVAVSVPLSIYATFTLMYFNDLTLNIMTLGGLALGAGMLVDNSIVVMENIFRNRSLGKDAKEAAIFGTNEVAVAILAATVTTIIVFLPIIYVKGVGAELFKDQAFTVIFSLISSLVVAFLMIPAAAAYFLRNKPVQEYKPIRNKIYHRLLKAALDNKWKVIFVTIVLAAVAYSAIEKVGSEFIPKSDQRQFTIKIQIPEGSRIETTSKIAQVIEDLIQEYSQGYVASVYSEIGLYTSQGFYVEEERGSNIAYIYVKMQDNDGVYLSTLKFIQALQPSIEQLPNVRAEFISQGYGVEQTLGGLSGSAVIVVKGPDLEQLEIITDETRELISSVPGLYNAKTSFKEGRPEINIVLDRVVAAGLGLDMNQVINTVRERIGENIVGDFQYGGSDRDIRLAYPEIDQSELENIVLTTTRGTQIKLKNVAEFRNIYAPKEILRESQVRIGLVSAEIEDGYTYSEVMAEVADIINSITLPRDYYMEISGEERERQQSFADLKFALLLAVILVYMVLAALFESFVHPFTIMLAVPMAGIGSIMMFYFIGQPLSIMAFIGIIMLAGIAVNDAIILVDYTNTLRKRGLNRVDALLQAGQVRFRPILMTSLTTILALIPLIIGIGEGAKLRAPLAYAVIGGLITSTLMTLVLTPSLYLILDNLRPKKYRES